MVDRSCRRRDARVGFRVAAGVALVSRLRAGSLIEGCSGRLVNLPDGGRGNPYSSGHKAVERHLQSRPCRPTVWHSARIRFA